MTNSIHSKRGPADVSHRGGAGRNMHVVAVATIYRRPPPGSSPVGVLPWLTAPAPTDLAVHA
jgi:hypothetical protein